MNRPYVPSPGKSERFDRTLNSHGDNRNEYALSVLGKRPRSEGCQETGEEWGLSSSYILYATPFNLTQGDNSPDFDLFAAGRISAWPTDEFWHGNLQGRHRAFQK